MNDNAKEFLDEVFGNHPSSHEESTKTEQPERTNRIAYNFKFMISCWSLIWAVFIIAVPQVKIKTVSALWFVLKDATNLIVWGPVYIFLIWLLGCLILYLPKVLIGKMQ